VKPGKIDSRGKSRRARSNHEAIKRCCHVKHKTIGTIRFQFATERRSRVDANMSVFPELIISNVSAMPQRAFAS
jgi:hypothetical protein